MSNINSYLRVAMMFGDNHSQTFIDNLEKMIELVLNEETPRAMLVDEIVDLLQARYGLNFTDVEVTQAIESYRGRDHIYCINAQVKRQGDRKYILNQKAMDAIAEREGKISVSGISELFKQEHSEYSDVNKEKLEELIDRYFYRCFNSNATTIMELLKQEYAQSSLLTSSDLDEDFTEYEKELLNAFIYWDNAEKDKFVYRMVACCFDYCTMTSKKDQSVYETVSKNKVFILDTNIIFRVIGINQGKRKLVIDAFLKKCREVSIDLVVTNVTREELHNTIIYNTNQIYKLISNTDPVNPRFLDGCANTGVNEDFYQFYYEWCQKPGHRKGDIASFREDLLNEADRICRQFTDWTYTTFDVISGELFVSYTNSLKGYKEHYKGHAREETVQTDVNNFMYVVDLNEKKGGNDFFGLNYFHISADHLFCNWAKSVRPGAIPEVILPSVWYSIILHYTGRATEDDYASFTRFLNFTLPTSDEVKSEKKTILLQKASRLDEPVDIKEEILQDVGKKLSSDYKDADDEVIDELIEQSRITATEKKVAEAEEKRRQEKEEALKDQEAAFTVRMKDMEERHHADMEGLKAEIRDKNNEHAEEMLNRDRESKDAVYQARVDERNKIIKHEAEKIAKWKHALYLILFIGMIIIPAGCALFFIVMILTGKMKIEVPEWISALLVAGVAFFLEKVIIDVCYGNWFCELKIEKIEEREKKKLDKKYPPIEKQ